MGCYFELLSRENTYYLNRKIFLVVWYPIHTYIYNLYMYLVENISRENRKSRIICLID